MLKSRILWLGTIAALVLGIHSACAQSRPSPGLYQIVSGRYIICCGFAGSLTEPLPNISDAFIELTVEQQKNLAQMKFLGQDMRTVLRIAPELSRGEFVYVLTNGVIFPDHIEFGGPFPPPGPGQPSFSFVVSNSADTLSINGTVIAPCSGCADVPELFQHTNVVAIAMPTAAVRVSEVEVCWSTTSNRAYQAQYRSTLTTNVWVDLGPRVGGTGTTTCITDKVPVGHTQGYYRVLIVP